MTRTALALISGGLDSVGAILAARDAGYRVELGVTFDYGQRSALREVEAAQRICAILNIPHRSLDLPFFRTLGHTGSLLNGELPKLSLEELDAPEVTRQSAASVWVPNRNGVFIEIAATLAEGFGWDTILVGFNAEEAVTFPDNTMEYVEAINRALSFSTQDRVQVVAPTGKMQKTEIAQILAERDFPFSLLWSCYEGGDQMCGQCESCRRLERALGERPKNELFKHVAL